MDVSIIIVNYNTSKLINDCLKSIVEKTTDLEFEVIIVDNNTENLSETINPSGIKNIRYIQLKENLGFGKANNQGAKIAIGRNLFCLNPDTLLINNAIKILSDYLDSHPKCGICGGNLYDINLKPINSYKKWRAGIRDALNMILKNYPAKILYRKNFQYNLSSTPCNVGYITGADLMIRKKLFNSINGYHPSYFMYNEDPDLCFRVHKLGYRIVSVPQAKIIHLEGQSLPSKDKLIYKGKLLGESLANYLNLNFNFLHKKISKHLYGLALKKNAKRSQSVLFEHFYKTLKSSN